MEEKQNTEENKTISNNDIIEEFKNVYVQLETIKRDLAIHKHEKDGKAVIIIPLTPEK